MKYSLHINKGIWHVSFYVKDINGKRRQKCLSTGFKAYSGKKEINKRKADEKARSIVEEFENLTDGDCVKWTLDRYVADWLKRNQPHISITTYDKYYNILTKHIAPYFSKINITIRDIKPMHLEKYCNDKIGEGLSANTVLKHIGIVSPALKDAVKNGYIRLNPVEYMSKPKKTKPQTQYYDVCQLQTLLSVCKNTPLEVPVILAVMLGLRRSEILGLKWSSIDFEQGLIHINHKVVSAKVDGKTSMVMSNTMKSEASDSQFALNDSLAQYLQNIKNKQKNYIRETSQYADYVCVNEVGELLKPDYITSKFNKILKQNNLPHIRFHDLRHSCLSLLANNSSFSMKQVQAYARHADFTTTANIYSHVNDIIKKAELDSITENFADILQ